MGAHCSRTKLTERNKEKSLTQGLFGLDFISYGGPRVSRKRKLSSFKKDRRRRLGQEVTVSFSV